MPPHVEPALAAGRPISAAAKLQGPPVAATAWPRGDPGFPIFMSCPIDYLPSPSLAYYFFAFSFCCVPTVFGAVHSQPYLTVALRCHWFLSFFFSLTAIAHRKSRYNERRAPLLPCFSPNLVIRSWFTPYFASIPPQ